MNSIYLILMIIIGATGIALIGSIFFCWIPSAHFRKVYHVGVILCEFLFLNFFHCRIDFEQDSQWIKYGNVVRSTVWHLHEYFYQFE